jgi:FkbM family methyltransferase
MIDDLVFDLGMHNGDDTAYYLHKGYRVLAVDANPAMIEKAHIRFAAELTQSRLILIHAAIAEKRGEIVFWVNQEWAELSSVNREFSSRLNQPLKSVTVPCLPLVDLFEKHGMPYYLKIDIEGNDVLCLKALAKNDLPAFCSWEAGGLEPLFLARNLGFDAFLCVDQVTHGYWGAPCPSGTTRAQFWGRLYHSCAIPVRIGRKLVGRNFIQRRWQRLRREGEWSFPMGATGTFGPYHRRRWDTLEGCAAAWLEAYLLHERDSERYSYPWTDFHAGRSNYIPHGRHPMLVKDI